MKKNTVIVTAMLFGDSVMTKIAEGESITDGLEWEDENGFVKEVSDIRDLDHVEYHRPRKKKDLGLAF